MEITIALNGEQQHIAPNTSLTALITGLGADPQSVAVLVNDEIVERNTFDQKTLVAGDSVELVRFVPGG